MSYSPQEQTELEARKEYWRETLAEFESEFYPIFAAHGISRNTALQAYMIDQVENAVFLALKPDGDNGGS
jgi:hypothetical protein